MLSDGFRSEVCRLSLSFMTASNESDFGIIWPVRRCILEPRQLLGLATEWCCIFAASYGDVVVETALLRTGSLNFANHHDLIILPISRSGCAMSLIEFKVFCCINIPVVVPQTCLVPGVHCSPHHPDIHNGITRKFQHLFLYTPYRQFPFHDLQEIIFWAWEVSRDGSRGPLGTLESSKDWCWAILFFYCLNYVEGWVKCIKNLLTV